MITEPFYPQTITVIRFAKEGQLIALPAGPVFDMMQQSIPGGYEGKEGEAELDIWMKQERMRSFRVPPQWIDKDSLMDDEDPETVLRTLEIYAVWFPLTADGEINRKGQAIVVCDNQRLMKMCFITCPRAVLPSDLIPTSIVSSYYGFPDLSSSIR